MARVLLVGESWFMHTIHQKGFDSFSTSEYEEGGTNFIAALQSHGHEVMYVPSHEIHRRLPDTAEGFQEIADVVIISDVGLNSFILSPATFGASVPGPDKTVAIRDFIAGGGGVAMMGGYMTFTGIDAKARWKHSALAPALPVTMLDRDDRVEISYGATPTRVGEHEITAGLPQEWPILLGVNELVANEGATVLAECAGHPLLVVGDYEKGRAAAFASDIAPHWAPPVFVQWEHYSALFSRLVEWLAADSRSVTHNAVKTSEQAG